MSGTDDFDIELGQSVRRHIEQKKSPGEDGKLAALPYDSPEKETMPVFIAEQVMRSIEEHVCGEIDKEVGGVLLGGYYHGSKGTYIEVTDFIEAKSAIGTDVSLTFTHDTWTYVNEEQSRRGGNAKIVGWYHSHPGLGVFMSKEDEFIHSSYFTEPWQIALVVDPVCHNWGCFRWNNDDLAHTDGFYVFGEKRAAKRIKEHLKHSDSSRLSTPQAASAKADRRFRNRPVVNATLLIVTVILLVTQAMTGYMLFNREEIPDEVDYYKKAQELLAISDLSGASYHLRQELQKKPESSKARVELKRLASILSDPSVAAYNNIELDSINSRLAGADQLAESGIVVRKKTGLEGLKSELGSIFNGEESITEHGNDRSRSAFHRYENEKTTLETRLARAVIVARLASQHTPTRSKPYDNAKKWLSYENYRRIAYGLSSASVDADIEYNKLSKKEQKIVDDIIDRNTRKHTDRKP